MLHSARYGPMASRQTPAGSSAAGDPADAERAGTSIRPDERLIVALDVPTHDEAVRLVDDLDNVSFFKIGLQLFLAGDLFGFLERLRAERDDGAVFIDLKTAGDIQDTVTRFVERAVDLGIRFMTFIEAAHTAITRRTLQAGLDARAGGRFPQFLSVPMLSDIEWPDDEIVASGRRQLGMGFDGLVASGSAIRALREAIPRSTPIISPGIRPRGSDPHGHVRWATPADAIQAGADYLVVGRPVIRAPDPRDMAQRIIDEIAAAG